MSLFTPLKTTIIAALVGAQVCLLSLRAEAAPELPPGLTPKARSLSLQYDAQSAAGSSTQALTLRFASGRQQLLATAECEDGLVRDFTRSITWEVNPPSIAKISRSGVITPIANGDAMIWARSASGAVAKLPVRVEDSAVSPPINFPNQVVPIFTKLGCNAGGCHGKSGGQNGFRLSLLGFEPEEDFEHLVKESRGRRLFPAAPDNSLLLLKAVGTFPHGGGKRLEADSRDYQLMRRWIAQGMPYGKTNDPTVERIEVYPLERTMERDGEQQLVVKAVYSNGSVEDVTASTQYDSNDKDISQVDGSGLVKAVSRSGDAAIMVRYQSRVAVFRAAIPLGIAVTKLPPSRGFIDDLVFKKLKVIGMPPSELCDDATFIRRVTVDIAGRLPTADETRTFLADTHPLKREYVVDALLDSPDYADTFANKWSALLRNKRGAENQMRGNFAFHGWIRDSLMENKPYDQFVSEILTASGDSGQNPPATWYRQVRDTTSQLEDSAQLFMGTRMKCAQCHHHPFEKWSQQDYFSLGAFFAQVGRKGGEQPGDESIYHKRGLATTVNKKTNQKVKPAALGAKAPELSPDDDPRQALAEWLGAKDNPFLAKALVNRYWKHFFNRALVEPEDDVRDTNPASNPELFTALARNFIETGFDLKKLVRSICVSSTYQLSAVPNEHNAQDRQFYSRYYPKRLTAEILLDAINGVTGSQTAFASTQEGTRAVQLPDNSYNAASYFLTVFGRPEGATSCECERSQDASLAQSLHLLNSKDIQAKLSADTGRAARMATDTKTPDHSLIESLYYAVYSRLPKSDEVAAATQHLSKRAEAAKDAPERNARRREAYEDILWALMSSKEFLFNH